MKESLLFKGGSLMVWNETLQKWEMHVTEELGDYRLVRCGSQWRVRKIEPKLDIIVNGNDAVLPTQY